MKETLTYWPIITGLVAIVGGIFGFFVALLRIKQLRLSVEKLEREVRESRKNIYRPTIGEIEKYGKDLERIVRESERSYHRHVEITKSFSEQAQKQIVVEAEISEQLTNSLRLFEEAEYRIHKLRKELRDLASALGGDSENQYTEKAFKKQSTINEH